MIRIFAMVVIALLAWSGVARGEDALKVELGELAKDVAATLKDNKVIKIGKFTDQGDLHSNFGPELQRVLIQQLTALGVTVRADAPYRIQGTYETADNEVVNAAIDPGFSLTSVRINATIANAKTGEVVNTLKSRAVFSNEVLEQVIAVSGTFPASPSEKQVNDELTKLRKKPKFNLDGTRIKSDANSPFAVEVLVVDKNETPDPEHGEAVQSLQGLPFVQIPLGKLYRLRVFNDADFDVAVKISIDGLDQFIFSDKLFRNEKDEPHFNYRIIHKHSSTVVMGWFRNLEEFDAFKLTKYADSAAASLKRDANEAGQIALQFFACWEKDADKPADEAGTKSADDATGRGPTGKQKGQEVHVTVGHFRAAIGLRYGSKLPAE